MLGIITLHFVASICSVSCNSLWKSTVVMDDLGVVKIKDPEKPYFKLRPGETPSTIHNVLQLQKLISNFTNKETGQIKDELLDINFNATNVGSKSKSHNIIKRYVSSSGAQQAKRRGPLEADKSNHAAKKRYPQYDSYGISQSKQNYHSSGYDQRDKSSKLNNEKQKYYNSDSSIYAHENIQMWPHAISQQTTNHGKNQEYSSEKAAGHSYDQGHDDHGKSGYDHHDHGHHGGYGHRDHGYGHDHGGYGHDHSGYGHDHGGYGHDHGGYGHDLGGLGHDHKGHGGHGHGGGYHKPSKVRKWEEGVHSKGYGTAGHNGHHGGDHQHDVKGQFKQDHHDHHKSQGSRVKTYSYGGKGWYKEQSHGNEKGYGGVKGHHQHNNWGNHKGKSYNKKNPYHEYNTKLDGYQKDHGYNYHK